MDLDAVGYVQDGKGVVGWYTGRLFYITIPKSMSLNVVYIEEQGKNSRIHVLSVL